VDDVAQAVGLEAALDDPASLSSSGEIEKPAPIRAPYACSRATTVAGPTVSA
jgi:hypothetical protein